MDGAGAGPGGLGRAPREEGPSRRPATSALPWLLVPPLLFLAAVAAASVVMDVDVQYFMQDPLVAADEHPLVGVASNVGVLVWAAGAAVCFFAAFTLRADGSRRREVAFLFWGGVLTAMLLVDDLFAVHEELAEIYLFLPETPVLAVEAAATAAYLLAFRRRLRASRLVPLLLVAFGFFAVSLGVDLFLEGSPAWEALVGSWHFMIEDGAKLLGIVAWSGYFWLEAAGSLRGRQA